MRALEVMRGQSTVTITIFMPKITIDVSRETFFVSRNWTNLAELHIYK
ncbi:hypothetical protein EMIT07CA2_100177 [Brevibacillus sp. IT-7CA2]